MDGLQRSTTSFRRQGSSGLVWDQKYVAGELRKVKSSKDEENLARSRASSQVHCPRSNSEPAYRTVKIDFSTPTIDPPSPKVSGCGFCGVFGKPETAQKPKKSTKRKS
ncbi:hypothetical protein ACSBR2_005604 [Camellia fascicularis]